MKGAREPLGDGVPATAGGPAGGVGGDQTFEQQLHRLEEIVRLLERGEQPLEASLLLYEEGMTLAKACGTRLDDIEVRIKELVERNGSTAEQDLQ